MIRIVGEYGGTIEKNTGDGLMAYFEDGGGDPPADGCLRATSCALSLDYARASLINPIIVASNAEPLNFRITIDYGYVTIAQIGAARPFGSLVAIGATANLASKMLDAADENQILLGENVVGRLPAHWQKWCVLHKHDTGWIYRQSQAPYRFCRYSARWTGPK